MALFLDKFPIVKYDITKNPVSTYDDITNILFRIGIIKGLLENISTYYEYAITEHDTPEILADNIYGNAEAHWIILYANNIYDPQYDWPLNSKQFQKYLIGKYGSIANAKTTYHHYEKVVTRQETNGPVDERRFIIDYDQKTVNNMTVPYDTYVDLPEEQSVETFDMGNGKTVTQITYREAITNYDHEMNENEKKRFIKIIKKEYYGIIMEEFRNLTNSGPDFLRKLI